MKYKSLTLQDIETIRPFYRMIQSRTCDFTVGGMFMWRDFYKMEYAIEDGTFFSRLRDQNNNIYYNIPISEDIHAAICRLITSEGKRLRFSTVPEGYLPVFLNCGSDTVISEQADYFDYLYCAADLALLKGKKYNGQRNLISQFKRSVDTWSFEMIDNNSINHVKDFFYNTYLPFSKEGPFEQEENKKVIEVLDNFDTYGMVGGYLIADGKIVGFSINEIVGDTLYTHIEKADRQYKGAYQMLVNQAAITFAVDEVSFINREEDMGDLGLRTSKKSYHPIELLKKYTIEVG